jgi:hypothetical protein
MSIHKKHSVPHTEPKSLKEMLDILDDERILDHYENINYQFEFYNAVLKNIIYGTSVTTISYFGIALGLSLIMLVYLI